MIYLKIIVETKEFNTIGNIVYYIINSINNIDDVLPSFS